jgi:hypothetical protein
MTSLKKLIAVLAISLPLAAMAQQAAAPAADKPPLAQIYGTLNANIQSIGAGGLDAGKNIQARPAVSLDSSNIGVKGTAPVAADLSATYQCETDAKLDGVTAQVTSVPTVLTYLCSRNSRLGLTHPVYGTLFFGNWDTPFKAAYYGTKADDPFGSTDVYGANNVMGSPGFNAGTTPLNGYNKTTNLPINGAVASFDLRAPNSIGYWTPKIMGVSGKVQVMVPEDATKRYYGGGFDPIDVVTGTNTQGLQPWIISAVVNYDMGPLSVLAAYEQHRDMQGLKALGYYKDGTHTLNFASRDDAWRVGAGYEVASPGGTTTLGVVWETLKYTSRNDGTAFNNQNVAIPGYKPGFNLPKGGVTNTGVNEYDRKAWSLNLKHRFGDHEARFRYNWADSGSCKKFDGSACVTDGLSSREATVGYAYYLAASTQVYGFYTKITNNVAAQYSPIAGGSVSGAPAVVTNVPAGADPEAFGAGIKYTF